MADGLLPPRSYGDDVARHTSRMVGAVVTTFALLAVCWVVEVVNYGGALTRRYGIWPHDGTALWHIFTAPFLHADLDHIMANSVPLAMLGFLAALRGVGRFVIVTLIVIVTSGLGVWLLAPSNVVTVGASGLIFGYFGYLLSRGFFERRMLDILIGVAVALLYGTMIFGVLPGRPGISWQAHLFGLVGGVVAARVARRA